MKKRFLTLAVCAAAISLIAIAPLNAQRDRDAAANIPQLPYHLVPDFYHYPANSIVGRVSGVAVGPKGNVMALNRGYHPVQEFTAEGQFVRSFGEGSTMFVGAHALRFDLTATSGTWMPPMTSFTGSTPRAAPWALSEQIRSPGHG